MHTAQTGIVFKGTLDPDVKDAASVWEDFRDSMRELATDQVAAAIATGAFDTVDTAHTGRIQGTLLVAVESHLVLGVRAPSSVLVLLLHVVTAVMLLA